MWQFVTVEAEAGKPTAKRVAEWFATPVTRPAPIGQIEHALTHRRYAFDVFRCTAKMPIDEVPDVTPRRWATLADLAALPLPRPHLRIVGLLDPQRPVT
jgi:adenine-specific DNA glycosylase